MVWATATWKTRPYAYRFAKLTGLGLERCNRAYTGTMGSWFNSKLPGWMLTVELPNSRRITRSKTTRYTNAVLLTHLRELQNLDRRAPALTTSSDCHAGSRDGARVLSARPIGP